jgi:NADH dehydrogenase FAD-containing subunit
VRIGAVGVEFAAEAKVNHPDAEVILVHSRDMLLNAEPLPELLKEQALACLREVGVKVRLGQRVIGETDVQESKALRKEVTLTGGDKISCDAVIYSSKLHRPNTDWISNSALDEKGYIRVSPT